MTEAWPKTDFFLALVISVFFCSLCVILISDSVNFKMGKEMRSS